MTPLRPPASPRDLSSRTVCYRPNVLVVCEPCAWGLLSPAVTSASTACRTATATPPPGTSTEQPDDPHRTPHRPPPHHRGLCNGCPPRPVPTGRVPSVRRRRHVGPSPRRAGRPAGPGRGPGAVVRHDRRGRPHDLRAARRGRPPLRSH